MSPKQSFPEALPRTPANTLLEYMEKMRDFKKSVTGRYAAADALLYLGFEDYLLQKGRLYTPQPLTDDEYLHLRSVVGANTYRQKECFYNAQQIAVSDVSGRLVYCEGYGHGRVIPCHHGWVTLNGKVVDLTWRTPNRVRGRIYADRNIGTYDPDQYAYWGVEFPGVDWLQFWQDREMTAGPVLEDYRRCFELYQGRDPARVLPQRTPRDSR